MWADVIDELIVVEFFDLNLMKTTLQATEDEIDSLSNFNKANDSKSNWIILTCEPFFFQDFESFSENNTKRSRLCCFHFAKI